MNIIVVRNNQMEIPSKMNTQRFAGNYINHQIKNEHIFGLRLTSLFRTVDIDIFKECLKLQVKRIKQKQEQKDKSRNNRNSRRRN